MSVQLRCIPLDPIAKCLPEQQCSSLNVGFRSRFHHCNSSLSDAASSTITACEKATKVIVSE